MNNWTEGDVITNGVRMHYYRTGDGSKPPLVLCHGFSDSGLCWTPTARALEADYDVVMIDARGHGTKINVNGRRDVKADLRVFPCREVDDMIELARSEHAG